MDSKSPPPPLLHSHKFFGPLHSHRTEAAALGLWGKGQLPVSRTHERGRAPEISNRRIQQAVRDRERQVGSRNPGLGGSKKEVPPSADICCMCEGITVHT